jgi:ABC-2 type transport system ATP-binding protein
MGVMLQEGGISPSARVADAIGHYCALYGRGADPQALVDLVGLDARAGSTWRRLSGGARQRLSLALALAARPDVAFLDEPTSGVDVNGRDTIRRVVRDLAAAGCAVVLATHELEEAERVADRALIFDHGRIVAAGTLGELRSGSDRIRFRSGPDVDVDALATALGSAVARVAVSEYVVEAAPDALVMSLLATWLHEHGHPLSDVQAGAQRLEDVFRRLTSTTDER